MDPFDKLLARFGENACLAVVILAVALGLKLAGAL
jgi:hypothetical protein